MRLKRDVESATGGSGIGLSVVRELVAMHGGRSARRERVRAAARVWSSSFLSVERRPAMRRRESLDANVQLKAVP